MMKIAALTACLGLLVPTAALADPILWTLNNVTFSDGGTASGSFIYDADFNTYSAINIETTPGTERLSGATYIQLSNEFVSNDTRVVVLTAAGSVTGASLLLLPYYGTPLTNAGGTVVLTIPISAEGTCINTPCTNVPVDLRETNSGSLVGVALPAPVPTLSEWAMITLGLILAGGAIHTMWRRRIAV